MRPISVAYTTTGVQTPVGIDWSMVPVNVAWELVVPAGVTFSGTLDHTYDNVNDQLVSVTPVWTSSGTLTATTEGTIMMPYQFIRLNIGTLSGGTATVFLKVNQATWTA